MPHKTRNHRRQTSVLLALALYALGAAGAAAQIATQPPGLRPLPPR